MKGYRITLIVMSVLLVLYIVAEVNKPTPINWTATLYCNDKIPYGTYIFYNQLKDIFQNAGVERTNKPLAHLFQDSVLSPGNYLIIAKTVQINRPEFKALTKFIARGNAVFIASFAFQGFVADTLKLTTYDDDSPHTTLNFTSPALKTKNGYAFKQELSQQYFYRFDTVNAVSLGSNQSGKSNYLRFSYGKGSLYLFANPMLLTNYNMLKPGGPEYVEKALSYLPPANRIYWDQYQNHDLPEDMSPMRVLFNHESLRWAYYIALFSMLLFVLYEIKRRQRVIPVIESLKNTTTEFVTIVGRVYYEQRNNANIALKKISYFSEYLRSNLHIKADYRNREFSEQLARKTGMDLQFIRELTGHINYIMIEPRLSDQDLIQLNNLIEKFYAEI